MSFGIGAYNACAKNTSVVFSDWSVGSEELEDLLFGASLLPVIYPVFLLSRDSEWFRVPFF